MNLWRRFKSWFEKKFLGYVEPGVYLGEVDIPEVAPTGPQVPFCAGAFERGPMDKAILCRSYEEFVQHFGNPSTGSQAQRDVYHFFMDGGEAVNVMRVTPRRR